MNLMLLFVYWTYILYFSCNHSTKLPSLFPYLLLIGIFLGSTSNLININLTSSYSSFTSLIVPTSCTLIYPSLLVRLLYLMFRLPTLYQTFLLLFCVLVQVSVSTQVLLLTQHNACPHQFNFYSSTISDMLSLSYPCFLLITITCISTMLKNIRTYSGEARSIWTTSLLSLAVSLAWVSAGLVYQQHYRWIKGSLIFTIFLNFCNILFSRYWTGS